MSLVEGVLQVWCFDWTSHLEHLEPGHLYLASAAEAAASAGAVGSSFELVVQQLVALLQR
jgi:hypothetical protein